MDIGVTSQLARLAEGSHRLLQFLFSKLALRPGYKGEKSNTTGCCSLRKKHLKLHKTYGDDEFVVEFDFLGKCNIPYHTRVQVEKKVFENLQDFLKKKSKDDYVFDKINVIIEALQSRFILKM